MRNLKVFGKGAVDSESATLECLLQNIEEAVALEDFYL
jgi:hypothetical protein